MDDSIVKPTRVPAALWESLQEICWRHDNKFVEDAARILGVPSSEIKRLVLGNRGTLSAIVTTNSDWYEGQQCPIMTLGIGEMWHRCSEAAEANGYCWTHRKGKGIHYDSPFITSLPQRKPFELEGTLVWVDNDGCVFNNMGMLLKDIRIDIVNGVCYDDRPTPPAWSKPIEKVEEEIW
jgi:hypothetical protein